MMSAPHKATCSPPTCPSSCPAKVSSCSGLFGSNWQCADGPNLILHRFSSQFLNGNAPLSGIHLLAPADAPADLLACGP